MVITRRAPDLLHRGEPDRVAWSIVREIKPKGDRGSIPRRIYDRRARGIGIEREIVLGRIHQMKWTIQTRNSSLSKMMIG